MGAERKDPTLEWMTSEAGLGTVDEDDGVELRIQPARTAGVSRRCGGSRGRQSGLLGDRGGGQKGGARRAVSR